MSAPPVLLFLGAGKKLGAQISDVFSEAGYKIAVVARTPKEEFESKGYYQVQADFNNHSQFKNRLCFGLGKTVAAYGIRFASVAYAKEGLKFYYADERTDEGLPVMKDIDGAAAGKEYLKLAETPEPLPWLYTYTKENGYKEYGEQHYLKSVDSDEPRFLNGGR
ncbi:hypothetical protein DL764_009258 [Monosporascus ibericus]|uniref:NmrA-like domain-containing protein n=1 Tax=Monosporascus ibericus TaxID=155417 RepID=A0A4Q4SVF1_9PEZI|nr:hypothetical protein DL764_009258 [Monosporascus ibericus]